MPNSPIAANTSAWGNSWSSNQAAPASLRSSSTSTTAPLTAATLSSVQRKVSFGAIQPTGKPLRKRDLVMIITQLSIMSRSGVDLADAISSLAGRAKRPDVRAALGDVHVALQNGESFSAALARRGGIFGEAMVAVIRAGEASGQMTAVLERLSVLLRDEMRLQATIRSIMSYPVLLLVVTSSVLIAMVFFVLPQFAEVYKTMNAPPPWFTQILLDFGSGVRTYWWAVLISIFGCGTGGVLFWRSERGMLLRDYFLLQGAMIGPMFKAILGGRALRLVGNMLESGVPLVEALQLASNATGNRMLRQMFSHIENEVMAGRTISNVLMHSPYIPEGAGDMVATAEATGQLANVLQTVGEFYEDEGEQLLRDGVKILEPIIIVGLGIIVAGVVLAVMLPLLDLSTSHH